jgi:hypothetical protein
MVDEVKTMKILNMFISMIFEVYYIIYDFWKNWFFMHINIAKLNLCSSSRISMKTQMDFNYVIMITKFYTYGPSYSMYYVSLEIKKHQTIIIVINK